MSDQIQQPTLGGVSLAWINEVAAIVKRDGHALREGVGPWIEAQSINNGLWYPLSLEGRKEGDVLFASIEDRNLVLGQIERLAAKPALPAEPASFFTPEQRAQATAALNAMSAIARR